MATAGRRALLALPAAILAAGLGWGALGADTAATAGTADPRPTVAATPGTATAGGDGASAVAASAVTGGVTSLTVPSPPTTIAGSPVAVPMTTPRAPGPATAPSAAAAATPPASPAPGPGPTTAAAPPPPPAPAPASEAPDTTNFAFYRTNPDGSPIRWNPCEPVHWVLNPAGGPADAPAEAQRTFDRLGAATGMTFVFDGTVDERPDPGRTGNDPARYPGRWAPVLVAFGDIQALGTAQMRWATPSVGSAVTYTGWVTLQAGAAWEPGTSTAMGLGRVLLHELGHLAGLGHAPRTGVVMNEAADGVSDYTPSDLTGLSRVGRPAGCLPAVPPPR